MAYFDNAKKGDVVFGLVFGKGTIRDVFEDSHYKIVVEFENEHEIPYTEDGVPGWGKFQVQTLFYKTDIDVTELDFSPVSKVLTPKKIIKLMDKKKLEVRLPSGIWHKCNKATKKYTREMLEKEKFHLFRKQPSN
ncbi:MAG: hypothetical protein PHF17_05640 [Arcobacteraceae bacterium]|jgi:hypothetical protein|nr:hypothetical protein [Arcobacteraceae bacterium]